MRLWLNESKSYGEKLNIKTTMYHLYKFGVWCLVFGVWRLAF